MPGRPAAGWSPTAGNGSSHRRHFRRPRRLLGQLLRHHRLEERRAARPNRTRPGSNWRQPGPPSGFCNSGAPSWFLLVKSAYPESGRSSDIIWSCLAFGTWADRGCDPVGGAAPSVTSDAYRDFLLDTRELNRVNRPAAERQEQHDTRQNAQNRAGHQAAPIRRALRRLRAEDAQRDGEHPHVLVLADQQWPQIVVPGGDPG